MKSFVLLCCAQLVSYILATLAYNFPVWLSFPTVTLIFTDIFSVKGLMFVWIVWQLFKHFVFVQAICFGAFDKITIAYSLFLLVNQGVKTFFSFLRYIILLILQMIFWCFFIILRCFGDSILFLKCSLMSWQWIKIEF